MRRGKTLDFLNRHGEDLLSAFIVVLHRRERKFLDRLICHLGGEGCVITFFISYEAILFNE
jgi:hypothetical protein